MRKLPLHKITRKGQIGTRFQKEDRQRRKHMKWADFFFCNTGIAQP